MQREQLARGAGSGGSSHDDDEGEVVMVRRSSAEARVTCGLCRGLLRDATTVPECLHSFCRNCIYKKFADEDSCCPTCNIDLGFTPLDKLSDGLNFGIYKKYHNSGKYWNKVPNIRRHDPKSCSFVDDGVDEYFERADHSLQSVRGKLFPSKRQKIEGVPSLHPASVSMLPLGVHGGSHPSKNTRAYASGEPTNTDQQGKNNDFRASRLLLVSNVACEVEIVQLHEDTEPPQSSPENARRQAEDAGLVCAEQMRLKLQEALTQKWAGDTERRRSEAEVKLVEARQQSFEYLPCIGH